jgi:hypothetical protein
MTETKAPAYVIAPEGCQAWLTQGKEYPVSEWDGFGFDIIDDTGDTMHCLVRNDRQLNGGDWIIPDEAEAAPKPDALDAWAEAQLKKQASAPDDRRFVAACHAMQGMGTWMPCHPDGSFPPDTLDSVEALDMRAKWAVRQADALLAALGGE